MRRGLFRSVLTAYTHLDYAMHPWALTDSIKYWDS